ncbi:MAG: orotidine-5'-phosphate decarboxylase [Chitinophagales bacterium]|nr:orotidine-5'-phosphate decarboxylase [Chitinophagales bacterium]
MNRQELIHQIKTKSSYLCVGLDPDIQKIPPHLLKYDNPILVFNQAIIEATSDICVAYKPNVAFFEALGLNGLQILDETRKLIPEDCFTIADAKRGDIGNTATMYAKAFLELMNFDSITVAPYMGKDSVEPFMQLKNKWAIVLGLTSNQGNIDFQKQLINGVPLYEIVMKTTMQWGTVDNLMFVVGATNEEEFAHIRSFCPEHFLLVPGVGAQGGDLEKLSQYGLTKDVGLLVNSTRSVIYASKGEDFAEKAREEVLALNEQMSSYISKYCSSSI